MAHELEQVFKELAHAGGTNEILEVQFAKTPAQVDPKVLIVDHFELPAVLPQKVVAIFVEGRDAQAGQVGPAQLLLHPLTHLLGGILGVGNSQNFVGTGMAFANQASDALGQDRGLSGSRTGDHQHRSVNMLDGRALVLVGLKDPRFGCPGAWNWLCDYHFAGEYQRWSRIILRKASLQFGEGHCRCCNGRSFSTQDGGSQRSGDPAGVEE